MSSHPLFEVGLKAFLMQGPRLLLVRERRGDAFWELPGGRIEAGEENRPATQVLAREMVEELGPELRFEVEGPVVSWSRPADGVERTQWVFLVGYLCRHVAGEIRLSDEHCEYAWVDAESWRAPPLAPGYESALAEFWRMRT